MAQARLTPLAASLPATVPFTGPETIERKQGRAFNLRLGANENGFGPSPRAIAAMQEAAARAWCYGDPEVHDLKRALAAHHGCAPENIVVGEGIDGLLGLLVRLIVGQGDPVVSTFGGYPTFNFHVAGFGGVLHTVPYDGLHEDPAALVAKAAEVGAKLVYFANPDNPMGTCHPAATVKAMVEAVPAGALLVLDEAYVDLAPAGTAPEIDPDDARVIRFRTFSKAHGLAGLRVGYAIGPQDLIAAFDRVRNHFGLGPVAQAGALAALQDQDWLAGMRDKIAASRESLYQMARENGLTPIPSATNFVTMDCGRDAGFAVGILNGFAARGVFIRKPGTAPHDRCIRISCGTPDEMARLRALFPDVMAEMTAPAS